MKTIVFQGYLKALYPDGIQVEANSAYEAVGLLSNYEGFRPEDGVIHKVFLPKFQSPDAAKAKTEEKFIEIVPIEHVDSEVFSGSGKNGGAWIQIIVGAVLVYFGVTAGYGAQMIAAGMAMSLGGILQLLMPAPNKSLGNTNDPKSNYLSANKNTVAIGTTIPMGFGRRKLYGHFLSFNVTATNLNANAPNAEIGTATGAANGSTPIEYNGDWIQYDSPGQ